MNTSSDKKAASAPAGPSVGRQGFGARKRSLLTFYDHKRTRLLLYIRVTLMEQPYRLYLTLFVPP